MQLPITRALVLLASLAVAGRAHAQAEPAPPDYHPPPPPGEVAPPEPPTPRARALPPNQPKWHIALSPHLNLRLGEAPDGVPLVGYGGGVEVTRALVAIGRGRFGVGARFTYDRYSQDQPADAADHTSLSVGHATFAALMVFDGVIKRLRLWLGLGGGLSVETFQSPATATGGPYVSLVDVVGLVTVATGFNVRIWDAPPPLGDTPQRSVDLGLRADCNLTFSSQTAGTPPRQVFAPGWFTLGIDLGFRF